MKSIEDEVIAELNKPQDRKERYNFTLSRSTKEALALWCKAQGFKESSALDVLIRKMVPEKYFKRNKGACQPPSVGTLLFSCGHAVTS